MLDDQDYWYPDKLTGRPVRLRAKPGEAVVTVAAGDLDQLTGNAAVRSLSRGANLRRGFAAVFVAPGRAAADLSGADGIANSIPVLVDGDGLDRYFLPDELTVQFRDGVSETAAQDVITSLGSRVLVRQRTPGYYTLAVPDSQALFATIRAFAERPEVAFAEPSEAGFDDALAHVPTDPDFGLLWGMRNTGQTVNGVAGTAGIDIGATVAWDVLRGDPDVIVTVIDTGADLDHPDLAANLLPRGNEDWDFADAADPSPDDTDVHGTHVAGTAAGAENTSGVVGVAPRCRIMPLRIDLTAGMNQNRADAINYVVAQAGAFPDRRYVINCSWRTSGDHAGIRTAIQNAAANDVVVVFAAGNANTNTDVTPQYPGVYPEVISVAALDQDGVRATFSNFGSTVDVAAPGVNIWSSMPDDTHGFLDGTSMASPHVAGLAALVWSAAPELSGAEVRAVVEDACDNVDALNPGFAGQLGRGRINAGRAVELAQFMAGYVPSLPAMS
ncbi:subtilisin family serine protease [Catenuloplanes nepalensis]|uniref:Subtilisin family serine protease n=1 Tax=Catenuloplanes nepalensis TaxID=587533 RepID=A0ABT9MSL7_9ACTN|nr:S8 family serine peptidase [Catenuloplanes nepalensis]MDP9794435.1 subtilisin family serine protease [Catenuloplanes nepalensis]